MPHETRYTVAEIQQALKSWGSVSQCPIACYYLEAELARRKGSANNGPAIRYNDEKHVKDRERKQRRKGND